MKEIYLLIQLLSIFSIKQSDAQIQKGHFPIGSDLTNLNFTLGGGGAFQARLDPKIAFFFRDNLALGGYVDFGLSTAKGAGTTINYGVGPPARYYINDASVNILRKGRFFIEGNAGIEGVSLSGGSSTNGLGLGIGPGYAYFIPENIGLETLSKYGGIVGFGDQPYRSNLNLGIGFQVYLGRNRIERMN